MAELAEGEEEELAESVLIAGDVVVAEVAISEVLVLGYIVAVEGNVYVAEHFQCVVVVVDAVCVDVVAAVHSDTVQVEVAHADDDVAVSDN